MKDYSVHLSETGLWTLEIVSRRSGGSQTCSSLKIKPPPVEEVHDEEHTGIPLYAERKWMSGVRLKKLIAAECSLAYALLPGSLTLKNADGKNWEYGADYYYDPVWGAFGRMPGSGIQPGDTVYASYCYQPYRIDSVVAGRSGCFIQKQGDVCGATPLPPGLAADESLLCNIFFDRKRNRLSEEMLYPFQEPCISSAHPVAEQRLPAVMKKLREGKPLKILAWGDSVTALNYLADEKERWLFQFTAGLKQRFPRSRISAINLGWPGKSSSSFLNEPADSEYSYQEKVLNSGADLVILEFVNDSALVNRKDFDRVYNRIRNDLKVRGMELIIIIPHPVRPDWMECSSPNRIENDPRPYIKNLKRFIDENQYAAADVSSRFLHLWKEGIPYTSLLSNAVNHPNAQGIRYFSEALLGIFPEQ